MRVATLTASLKGLFDFDASQSIFQSENDVVVFDEDNCTVETHLSDAFAPVPKSVCFTTLEIHRHAIIPGYNPGGTLGGPPLDIDWWELNKEVFPLEEFEATRGPRRDALTLKRSKEDRWQVLLGEGFTQEEIQLAEDLAEAIHLQRQISSLDVPIEEVISSHTKEYSKEVNVVFKPDSLSGIARQKEQFGLLRGLFRLKRHSRQLQVNQ